MNCRVVPHSNYCRERLMATFFKDWIFPLNNSLRWSQGTSVKAMRFLEKNLFLRPSRWGKAHLDGCFPFSSRWAPHQIATISQIWRIVAWKLNLPIPPGPTDGSYQVPPACVPPGCSWTWSSPTVGCCHSSSSPALPSASELGSLRWRLRGKKKLSPQPSPYPCNQVSGFLWKNFL